MPHSGHKKHLCYLVNVGFQTSRPKDYLMLVQDPCLYAKSAAGPPEMRETFAAPENCKADPLLSILFQLIRKFTAKLLCEFARGETLIIVI